MHRDVGVVHVVARHGGGVAEDMFAGEEVVEGVLGQVEGDGSGVFLRDGGDEEGGAEEELRGVFEDGRVGGVEVEEGEDGAGLFWGWVLAGMR